MIGPDVVGAVAAAATLTGIGVAAERGYQRKTRREHKRDQARLRAWQAHQARDDEPDTVPVIAVTEATAIGPVHAAEATTIPLAALRSDIPRAPQVPAAADMPPQPPDPELDPVPTVTAVIVDPATESTPIYDSVKAASEYGGVHVRFSDLPLAVLVWKVTSRAGGEYCARAARKEITP